MDALSMPCSSSPLQAQNGTSSNGAPGANMTTATLPGFSPGIMDTLLTSAGSISPLSQLLFFFHRLLASYFGIDPSMLLTTLGFIWGLSKLLRQAYVYGEALIDRYFMCAMHISEDDCIYDHVMKFMAQSSAVRNNKQLMAQTMYRSAWEDYDDDDEDDIKSLLGGDDNNNHLSSTGMRYLNFANQAATCSPRFIPALGRTSFWHNGTYFKFYRFKESFASNSGWAPFKDMESVKIACYGWSIDPVKRLLQDCKALYWKDMSHKTAIFRPRAKEMRRDHNMWQQVARRPVRPIRTVVLDHQEKHDVLADVNEYLHPATPRWYASRGIPLRRGYLFHGPPGTGKTSFSFALAGVFGIDIYVISLQDVSVTEEDLAVLFTKLPRRCVILLEDVDSAGLHREGGSGGGNEDKKDKEVAKGETKTKSTTGDSSSNNDTQKNVPDDDSSSSSSEDEARKLRNKRRRLRGLPPDGSERRRDSKKGISLSGLLNAIDGVASHEGRVLIMTTNKPESLDEALVRPGRVDVQVGFSHASPFQVEELFQRMYEEESISSSPHGVGVGGGNSKNKASKSCSNGSVNGNGIHVKRSDKDVLREQANLAYKVDDVVDGKDMEDIAAQFARCIPEGKFSPAEIQGFLLKRKKSPRRALHDVQAWVEASLKQKESKSKVVTVQ